MGTHLIGLSKDYPMNTNMRGLTIKYLHPCSLDESSLSIGKVNSIPHQIHLKAADWIEITKSNMPYWEATGMNLYIH